MAKTDWKLTDKVLPDDLNQIGAEINAKETPGGAQDKADAALNAAKQYTDDELAEIEIPVTSVNNKTGDVVLTANDVGAEPTIVKKSGFNLDKSDSVTSTSSDTLATSRAVKTAMDRADSAFQQVSDGKNTIATAITDMGQSASGSDTHSQLASKIKDISKDANASAGDVENGKTFYQGGVKRTGTLSLTGDAAPSEVLAGKTFYNNALKTKRTGTLVDRTGHVLGQSISRSGNTLRIRPQGGRYLGGSGNSVAYTDNNWIENNIREGVNMFGKVGTMVPSESASGTSLLLQGGNNRMRYFYVDNLGFLPKIDSLGIYGSVNANVGPGFSGYPFAIVGSDIIRPESLWFGAGTNRVNLSVNAYTTPNGFYCEIIADAELNDGTVNWRIYR